MKKALKKAYETVIKDLEKSGRCKEEDYTFACFECEVAHIAKQLKSYLWIVSE